MTIKWTSDQTRLGKLLTLVEELQVRLESLVMIERVRLELVDQQILK